MIISVASGKGGTGKTTVSVNLVKTLGPGVHLLDCDVEEPNCHLFFKGQLTHEEPVTVPIPGIDEKICDACGECSLFCQYHAIVSLKSKPLVFPELCHGCGGCLMVCPRKAIQEENRRIGIVRTIKSNQGTLIEGRLDVGVAMSPPVIRAVKSYLPNGSLAILDAPPGTSCPVVATIRGSDFVLLVTEPTPFGLHDLAIAVEMVREIGIPFGVVINRIGVGDDRVHVYCRKENIPILMELPDDRRIAEAYSMGIPLIDRLPEYRIYFEELMEKIMIQLL